jgi:hypothetical protein
MLSYLFEANDLFTRTKIIPEAFLEYAGKIQEGYKNNPYHNAIHSCDVLQTVNYFLKHGNFMQIANLSAIEILSMYFAAAVHDFEHPGTNNLYQINFRTHFALRYNDRSVLEMHHIAAASALLLQDRFNFLANCSIDLIKRFRERTIAMVLATDMQYHFTDLNKLKTRLSSGSRLSKPFVYTS